MSRELDEIKEEIFNCGLLHKLLESVGCHGLRISGNGERLEGARPDGDNPKGFLVYLNEGLSSIVQTRKVPTRDIFDLISYFKYGKETLDELNNCIGKSKNYIIETLGFTQFKSGNYESKPDPNAWLKEIAKRKKKKINLDEVEPNKVLSESVLDEFVNAGHMNWVKDNIPLHIQNEFEVCFDIQSERICLPVRNRDGFLIGVKGRATRKEDEERYKYLPIYSFQKSKELFNLHKAIDYIRDKNEIVLFESEKSVLKSWHFEQYNTCSQMGSDITRIQAAIIRTISPDIRIVLSFDKDKSISEIKNMAKVFGNHENLYAIYDKDGLLNDNESPVDQTKEIWQKLYKNYCFKIPV